MSKNTAKSPQKSADETTSQYRKRFYQAHPEIREQYRITENINNLRRHGYTVIPPQDQAEVVANG